MPPSQREHIFACILYSTLCVSFVALFTVVIMLSVIVVVASFFNVNSTHKGGELCLVHHCNLRGKECLVLKKSVG